MREAGLRLVGTHLRLPAAAPLARTASADEGCRDPVSERPLPHVGAHRDDHADEFVTGYVGKRDPVVVPGPGVPVAAAQTRGMHLHDHATRRRLGIGDGPHVHRAAKRFEHHRAHALIVACML